MSEITAIAEKAAEEIYGHVSYDGYGGIDFEREEIVKIIEEAARAAIEANEAEQRKLQKHRDTLHNACNEAYIRGGYLDRVGRSWPTR